MAIVSIARDPDVIRGVREAIDLLSGIEKFVHPGDRVVIKPNLVFALPADTGFTTDPTVVRGLLELLGPVKPSEVIIAEGSGGADTKMAFERCGYARLARSYGVGLVDLNAGPSRAVHIPGGKSLRDLKVPEAILDGDVLINVPKLKLYRGKSWASLCVKNLMGAVPGRGDYSEIHSTKFSFELSPEFYRPGGRLFLPHHRRWWGPNDEKERIHENLAESLVDLNRVIRPSLNIIDAISVSPDVDMGNTKGGGSFKLNGILAGADPLAVDCIALAMGGMDLGRVSYLKRAAERGIGESDPARIRVRGVPVEDMARTWEEGTAPGR